MGATRRSFLQGMGAGIGLSIINPALALELERAVELPQEVINTICLNQPITGPTGVVSYFEYVQHASGLTLELSEASIKKDSIPKANLLDVLLNTAEEFDGNIDQASNNIAYETRRGVGNWVLSHPNDPMPTNRPNIKVFRVDDPRLRGKLIVGYASSARDRKVLQVDGQIIRIDDGRYVVCDTLPSYSRIVYL